MIALALPMPQLTIRRLDFGRFTRPAEESPTGEPLVEVSLGYVVLHPDGPVLFDTGMGTHPEVDAHYQPGRRSLDDALASAGLDVQDITMVVNCHLHFDHCGGNPRFPGVPIVVQRAELQLARAGGHTLDELVDFPGVRWRVCDGEAQLRPGLLVVPTPGHTAGHQSLLVDTRDGPVILAGQATESATDFARLTRTPAAAPSWVRRFLELEPNEVCFAVDECVWRPAR